MLGGGTISVTFSRNGEFRMLVHFLTSGNCSFKICMVLEVAVAVIIRIDPPRLLSSPELSDIIGLKAFFCLLSIPQLATGKE